jgi:modification methylase
MVNFSGSFYAPNTERIFIIAKEEWTPRKECLGWGEIWRVAPETNNEHPAPYPLKLAERVISSATFETDLILDPFLGSGTTLVAAKILGRKAIGIEISEKYCDIAAKRLSQSVMQLEIPKEDVKTETML